VLGWRRREVRQQLQPLDGRRVLDPKVLRDTCICILSNVVRVYDDREWARISRRSRTDIDLTHGASSIDSLCQSRIFIVVIRSDRFKQLLVYTTKNITIIANPIQSPIQSNPSESNGAHSC